MTLESRFSDLLDHQLQSFTDTANRIVLAFSGGLDSCVLLHLLAARPRDIKLLLWHINHGLQDCASDMESFCVDLAGQYDIEIKVSHLNLGQGISNVESVARSARYAEFQTGLGAQDILLTAHHADDQAETFFLNLFRRSGSAGLSGIARVKPLGETWLARPLLDIEREELVLYADHHSLKWFDDPSNLADRYNRNYLRNQVIPAIKNRWPGFVQSIGSVCHIQTETQQLLDEIAEIDYRQCKLESTGQPSRLSQEALMKLSPPRQKNLIRFWLRQNSCQSLPAGKLLELVKQLDARRDAQPMISATGYDIRIYSRQLFIVAQQHQLLLKQRYDMTDASILEIEAINLRISRDDILEYFELTEQGQAISMRFRCGHSETNKAGHRLKHLFQRNRVPPWMRDQTPQIFIDDELQGIWLNKTIEK
jgi:tRNA(Ile)-lysidine synthase